MQRLPITLLSLLAAIVLLAGCSRPDAPTSSSADNDGLVASFDFQNPGNIGQDAVVQSRSSVVVGKVLTAETPLGCAAAFDGKSRISMDAKGFPNLASFSVAAWINGGGTDLHTLEQADRRGPNFQVVGDKIYFVTNSDGPLGNRTLPKTGPLYYPSVIWSGYADVNLASWNERARTKLPLSGLEPKLQVVGDRMYFEYFGGDADGTWQIYTGTAWRDGTDWVVRQRTDNKTGYAAEQSRNIQVVGDKIYYAFPLKDKDGFWQLWTATSNIDGSSWKPVQQTSNHGPEVLRGFIPSFRVSGDKIYYIYVSAAAETAEVVIASAGLDGSDWREIRRIRDAGPWLVAQLAVAGDAIHYTFTKRGPRGNVHFWTGKMLKDGSFHQERQRTFGETNAGVAGIQVVGNKILYSFPLSQKPASTIKLGGAELMGMSFWTASTDLDGEHWVQHRKLGDDDNDYLPGYKMLANIGGKSYYDIYRLHFTRSKDGVVGDVTGILAYSGSNILNKGDAYGIGMSASGDVSGFVNAGEDYLYRGEAPEDTAGALIERKLAPGWHHVAVTYDDNFLRLYVDGKLARETRYDRKPAANPFPLSIGDGFVGKIAQVKLFDRALDPSEITDLAAWHGDVSCPAATQ